jgi:hypothetical protein
MVKAINSLLFFIGYYSIHQHTKDGAKNNRVNQFVILSQPIGKKNIKVVQSRSRIFVCN